MHQTQSRHKKTQEKCFITLTADCHGKYDEIKLTSQSALTVPGMFSECSDGTFQKCSTGTFQECFNETPRFVPQDVPRIFLEHFLECFENVTKCSKIVLLEHCQNVPR